MRGEGFKYLLPRNINQDALENFFSCIRSHGVRNVNPTCTGFRASFKSLIINNFVSPHSPGANCEEDDTDGPLDSLRFFIMGDQGSEEAGITNIDANVEVSDQLKLKTVTDMRIIQNETYLTGYLSKQILKNIGICKVCRSALVAPSDSSSDEDLIYYRSYGPRALMRPRTKFVTLFNLCYQVCHFYIVKLITCSNIKAHILNLLYKHINVINFPACNQHDLMGFFFKHFVNFYIYAYIKSVNNILSGKILKNVNDAIKHQALRRWHKYKKYRR